MKPALTLRTANFAHRLIAALAGDAWHGFPHPHLKPGVNLGPTTGAEGFPHASASLKELGAT